MEQEEERWAEKGSAVGLMLFFFKQKTAYEILTCDWSSDVCSSDLTMSCILCFRCQNHLKPRVILLLNIFICDVVIAVDRKSVV